METGPNAKLSAVDEFGNVTGEKILFHLNPEYQKYRVSIRESERRNGLPENSLRDVLSFDPDVISGKGRHKRFGSLGIAQMMPDVAQRFGVKDRTNPHESIAGAGRYMKHLLLQFATLKRAQAAFLTSDRKEAA